MGFRIIELFVLLGLIVFIANVIHFFLKTDFNGGGLFFLSKKWEEKSKKKGTSNE